MGALAVLRRGEQVDLVARTRGAGEDVRLGEEIVGRGLDEVEGDVSLLARLAVEGEDIRRAAVGEEAHLTARVAGARVAVADDGVEVVHAGAADRLVDTEDRVEGSAARGERGRSVVRRRPRVP